MSTEINTKDSNTEFGLTAPGKFGADATLDSQPIPERSSGSGKGNDRNKSGGTGGGGGNWKGFEEEEEDPDPGVDFGGKEMPEDELDMTPMVDVTFLLLIFFMVTASFTLRQAFQQAHSQVDDPSPNAVTEEDNEDFIQVTIDQTNTYYIQTRDTEEIEAPSDREMRDILRNAKENTGAKILKIVAHVDSLHGKVVKVLDIANSVGMERIQKTVTEEEY